MTVITDKLEVGRCAGTLYPPLYHQCSVLRVSNTSQSYSERREVEVRKLCHQGPNSDNSEPPAPKAVH